MTHEPQVITAAPAHALPGKSSRGKYLVIGVLASIAALVAFGAIAGAAQSKHTIKGTMTLYDSETYDYYENGDGCSGEGGYGDIDEGTDVRVKDASGDLIGSGRLESGTVEGGTCVFDFTVDDVDDASYYSVEVSYRGDLSFSKSEMDDNGWQVDVTLGDDS
jgi:hypothetical protein